jgi:glycopeptide antibiotics resistance protein
MTFQYFLFDTYPGYFIEALPLAIFVSIIFYIVRYKNDKVITKSKKIVNCLFVCYITGLLELVWFIDIISNVWYYLLYHMDSGAVVSFFTFEFNLIPNFWNHLNSEVIGNMIMFIPFGVLFSLSQEKFYFRKTLKYGALCTFVIEILQPLFGRSFDINDLLMNIVGVIVGTFIYLLIKKIIKGINK